MAHTPELPDEFVCRHCQVIHAGSVESTEDELTYRPPAECGACGHTEFVPLEMWARVDASN